MSVTAKPTWIQLGPVCIRRQELVGWSESEDEIKVFYGRNNLMTEFINDSEEIAAFKADVEEAIEEGRL